MQNCRGFLTEQDVCLSVSITFRSRQEKTTKKENMPASPCQSDFLGCRCRMKCYCGWDGRSSFRNAVLLQGTERKRVFRWGTKPWILAVSEKPCLPALRKGCPRTRILQVNAPQCILLWWHHLITTLVPWPGRLLGSIQRCLEGHLGN